MQKQIGSARQFSSITIQKFQTERTLQPLEPNTEDQLTFWEAAHLAEHAWTDQLVTHSLRADGFDASEDGTGRGTPIVPTLVSNGDAHSGFRDERGLVVGFSAGQSSKAGSIAAREEQSPTLRGAASGTNQVPAIAIAWDEELNAREDQSGAVVRGGEGGRHAGVMTSAMAVRRLTPRECERLQGLPDDYTLVPFNGKPAADGPRYKAIGNGMAVPVVKWIGERIQAVQP